MNEPLFEVAWLTSFDDQGKGTWAIWDKTLRTHWICDSEERCRQRVAELNASGGPVNPPDDEEFEWEFPLNDEDDGDHQSALESVFGPND